MFVWARYECPWLTSSRGRASDGSGRCNHVPAGLGWRARDTDTARPLTGDLCEGMRACAATAPRCWTWAEERPDRGSRRPRARGLITLAQDIERAGVSEEGVPSRVGHRRHELTRRGSRCPAHGTPRRSRPCPYGPVSAEDVHRVRGVWAMGLSVWSRGACQGMTQLGSARCWAGGPHAG